MTIRRARTDYDSNINFLGTGVGYGESSSPGNGLSVGFSVQEDAVAGAATGASTWSSNGDTDAGLALTIALLYGSAADLPQDHAVDAGNVSWVFDLPQPSVTHTLATPTTTDHAVSAGVVSWVLRPPRAYGYPHRSPRHFTPTDRLR